MLVGGAREKHWDLFKQWAHTHEAALAARIPAGGTIYGEWVYAKHTVFYDQLPHYFLEFDIRDAAGVFWSTARRAAHLAGSPIVSVPILWQGVVELPAELPELVAHSRYKSVRWREQLGEAAFAAHPREHVCALVRNHQIPLFGITRAAPDAARLAIRLSLVTRNDWLVAVADADARGRRCADPADQVRIIDHCALWAEHCRELGVLDRAFAFPTSHTARVWLESDPGSRPPDLTAHDDTVCEVVLMAGLPASGKDTWLRSRPGLPVVSLDDLRLDLDVRPEDDQAHVIAAAREQARGYLRTATSFAWNATNLSAPLRSQLLGLFRGYRARTHVVYCEVTASEQRARNRARSVPVPAAVIDRMLGRWTVPDPTEAHEVTHVVLAASGELTWPCLAPG